jgi:hypothetical protein
MTVLFSDLVGSTALSTRMDPEDLREVISACRLALSPEDAAARALLLTWCEPIGLKFEQDAIGNMFLITGEPSHVGPTTMDRRRDSLAAAAEVILAVEQAGVAAENGGRTSASWIQNFPNARGNVSNSTRLHCDVRHEDAERARAMEADLREVICNIAARRRVRSTLTPTGNSAP